ncbi:peptidase [Heyndrickxia shackletonii]|uniref:Peptidase n=1 Tax=Heyndrickxia shackletonii TaxID=157838 RepID=A0A0Q3T958_9BACI|nr:C39 family peptidase [Heyndrickxia shackletonii]KQL50558.1 peptidase [Heyndrickxia shackletonii]NEY98131.1 peptidase [Heyndrickxia shackletonii]
MAVVNTILLWLVLTTVFNAYLMTLPRLDLKKGEFPEKFQIYAKNRIDIQENFECAAFSTAYVLRHFGIEADGFEIYDNFPSKLKTGYVYPKGIRTYLKQKGFKTIYYKGNISTLKRQISKGNPVIVFIKVHKKSNNLHFVPVIGYDKDYLYIAESLDYLVNCKDDNNIYNRKVSIDEFKKLWNIKNLRIPFYSNTYITIEG